MKVLIILLVTSYATAEAPSAPYYPSGFRPEGEPFTLPPFKFKQQQRAASQNQFRPAPQTEYGAPVSPQRDYLPPANNNQVSSVTPLHQQITTSKNGQSVLRPEDQYVPPRPFSENQSVFNPRTLYNSASIEQSQPQQISQFQDQYSQVAYQKQYNATTKERQNFRPQGDFDLNNQYGVPTTSENSSISTQDNFGEQRLLSNQQRVNGNYKNKNLRKEAALTQQTDGNRNPARRLVQRRRKQQRRDHESLEENQRNRPAGSYGVPSTPSTPKSVIREPESTTRPFKRIRTTTVSTEQSTNEEETEDVAGPNISIATAVAGRYYILQPVGELRGLQSKSIRDENKKKVDQPDRISQNLVAQSRLPILTYNFDSPLIQLSK